MVCALCLFIIRSSCVCAEICYELDIIFILLLLMKDELIEFAKYYAGSAIGKILSFYIIPSLILGQTYYEVGSFAYLKYSILLLNGFNFLNQLLFGTRYKMQVNSSTLLQIDLLIAQKLCDRSPSGCACLRIHLCCAWCTHF